ncbi:MAG: 23S rRNA (guanosine(2251)-2'-O)-methyltransferase RlmB [Coriobacteriaceae bacterium]|nr:23S rRNA (guanosine(2251)-2'-O)-methyltransferase RlmB [Coriobacteriaceae bacterium]
MREGQRSGQRQGFSPSRGGRPQGGYGARPQGRGGQRPQGRGSAGRSDLIEGRRAVEEALGAGVPLKSALVQIQSLDADPALERLAQRLDAAGVSVERVPRNRLDQLSSHGAHQGVIVRAKPFQYAELGDVIAAAGKGNALVLVLDHVTDEGNFGAIVRTAEVVGAAGVVIAKARSASVGVGAYKTSAGAVLHIPIAQVSNLARAVEELKAAGFWACASTEHATDDVWSAPLAGRVALVMGSEGEGISRLVLEKCDFACKLPQRGRVESLNVAQACTVMCYEWLRREMSGEGTRGV